MKTEIRIMPSKNTYHKFVVWFVDCKCNESGEIIEKTITSWLVTNAFWFDEIDLKFYDRGVLQLSAHKHLFNIKMEL